jgi:hypothetical protein
MNPTVWIPIFVAAMVPLSQALDHALKANTLPNLPWLAWTPKSRAIASLVLGSVVAVVVASATGAATWSAWGTALGYGLTSQVTVVVNGILAILMPPVLPASMSVKRPSSKPPSPPFFPTAMVTLVALVAMCGCAGSLDTARGDGLKLRLAAAPAAPSIECLRYDSAHRTWGGIAEGAAFAAGASGLAIIPIEDKTGRVLLVSGGVVLGTAAAISTWVASDYAAAWARECSQ